MVCSDVAHPVFLWDLCAMKVCECVCLSIPLSAVLSLPSKSPVLCCFSDRLVQTLHMVTSHRIPLSSALRLPIGLRHKIVFTDANRWISIIRSLLLRSQTKRKECRGHRNTWMAKKSGKVILGIWNMATSLQWSPRPKSFQSTAALYCMKTSSCSSLKLCSHPEGSKKSDWWAQCHARLSIMFTLIKNPVQMTPGCYRIIPYKSIHTLITRYLLFMRRTLDDSSIVASFVCYCS